MAVRIPWDQSEAVLLVDAYFMIEKGIISRWLAVQLVSEELRNRALLSNLQIDSIFRNTNGINMRFYEIQYIVSNGESGMKNTSKLFIETVRQHSNNIIDFQSKYQEALAEIYGKGVIAFKKWLNHSKYNETTKAIEYSLRILDTLGHKEGLMKGSLCDFADMTMIENLGQAICNNAVFKIYTSRGYDHEKLFVSYKDYLNDRRNEKGSEHVVSAVSDKVTRAKKFSKWLIDVMKLSTATARGYSSAINTASQQ